MLFTFYVTVAVLNIAIGTVITLEIVGYIDLVVMACTEDYSNIPISRSQNRPVLIRIWVNL